MFILIQAEFWKIFLEKVFIRKPVPHRPKHKVVVRTGIDVGTAQRKYLGLVAQRDLKELCGPDTEKAGSLMDFKLNRWHLGMSKGKGEREGDTKLDPHREYSNGRLKGLSQVTATTDQKI